MFQPISMILITYFMNHGCLPGAIERVKGMVMIIYFLSKAILACRIWRLLLVFKRRLRSFIHRCETGYVVEANAWRFILLFFPSLILGKSLLIFLQNFGHIIYVLSWNYLNVLSVFGGVLKSPLLRNYSRGWFRLIFHWLFNFVIANSGILEAVSPIKHHIRFHQPFCVNSRVIGIQVADNIVILAAR